MDSTPPEQTGVAPQPENDGPDRPRRALWQGKIGPAFWTVASLLSLTINVILIIILILAGRQLFSIKNLVTGQLIGGLYYNFIRMDQARISTQVQVQDTIQVSDTIPVVFDLALDQKTRVVLTEDTLVEDATIFLNGQPVPIDIILKEGTPLNIHLNMTIPVDQTVPVELKVPVSLTVPVNIPLNQTELHEPFVGLQEVISPYYWQLSKLPDSWSETIFCSTRFDWLCGWLNAGESPTQR
jgi:hypothetical protein